MRSTTLLQLAIPALAFAQDSPAAMPERAILSGDAPPAVWVPMTTITTDRSGAATPTPDSADGALELRQATAQVTAATTAASQMGATTTVWLPTMEGSSEVWVEVIYTQTFASVVDQWTTSGSGSIGLGTITGVVGKVKKSDASSAIFDHGIFLTAMLGAVGVVAGMGMVWL